MDRYGVDAQVLSISSARRLSAEVADVLARNANDTVAGAVARHPERFAAFAALPIAVPEAAAR